MATAGRGELERWIVYQDVEAFHVIVQNHAPMVHATCLRILQNRADAEEVTQECFEILAASKALPHSPGLAAWLHAIATNRALMRLRSESRRRNRETIYAAYQPESTEISWTDVYQHVDEALCELPEPLRALVVAHYFEGKSLRGVARALGMPRQTVRKKLDQALELLGRGLRRRGVVMGLTALALLLRNNTAQAAALPLSLSASLARLVLAQAGRLPLAVPAAGVLWTTALVKSFLGMLAVVFGALLLVSTASRAKSADPAGAPRASVASLSAPVHETAASFGQCATLLPDITGNSAPELVISAHLESAGLGFDDAGRVHLFDSLSMEYLGVLDSPHPEPQCGPWGCTSDGSFGGALAVIQDLNGNGASEIVVGAPAERLGDIQAAGHVYIFDGLSRALLRELTSPNPEAFSNFGAELDLLEDIDGDGIAELLVGAIQESPGKIKAAGRAYVLSGATGAVLHTLESPDMPDAHLFGYKLSHVQDIDGDGFMDILVGQAREGRNQAHLFSGRTGNHLRTLASPLGPHKGSFGNCVRGAGDLTGDGIPELMVAALNEPVAGIERSGQVYVFDGAADVVLHTFSPPVPLLDGQFGANFLLSPDLSGDGAPDMVIGANRDAASKRDSGAVNLFNSADGAPLATLRSPANKHEDGFGSQELLAIPDLNGDGLAELLVAAQTETIGDIINCGQVHLFYSPFGGALETGDHVLTTRTTDPTLPPDTAAPDMLLASQTANGKSIEAPGFTNIPSIYATRTAAPATPLTPLLATLLQRLQDLAASLSGAFPGCQPGQPACTPPARNPQ